MVRRSTDDVKTLAAFPNTGQHTSRKTVQTKLSKEFATAVAGFQRVQRLSAEKQRTHVENQKRQVDKMIEEEA